MYHVYNRGVEKRNVFCERVDYIRFIHDLFEFNDTTPAVDFMRRNFKNVGDPNPHIGKSEGSKKEREKLTPTAHSPAS